MTWRLNSGEAEGDLVFIDLTAFVVVNQVVLMLIRSIYTTKAVMSVSTEVTSSLAAIQRPGSEQTVVK